MIKRFQADDALATAAVRFAREERVEQVVICTPDKDLAQCVLGTHVVLLDRVRQRTTDEAGVLERFGVLPGSIPDFLALAGDAADGLPGLPGFGPRSASVLLRRFERIERIPADAKAWEVSVRGAERLARTLRERKKEALLYRELTRLYLDVPLQESLGDLAWRGPNREALERLCERIGDRSVLDRLPGAPRE
jgi:5'-3' exonuclease